MQKRKEIYIVLYKYNIIIYVFYMDNINDLTSKMNLNAILFYYNSQK